MEYEPVVGIEVHAQLLTKSKMFCGCSADYMGAPPTYPCCPVCLLTGDHQNGVEEARHGLKRRRELVIIYLESLGERG